MSYEKLDGEELLKLALDAMTGGRDAESVVMLKTLLEREPEHAMARYLLAAQHAQLGMLERAEEGFRQVVADAPAFPIARFQLGQLLLTRGAAGEAGETLLPLTDQDDAIGAYARALYAASQDEVGPAIAALEAGLGLPQDVPALEYDMRQLLGRLQALSSTEPEADLAPPPVLASPIFMTGYGQAVAHDD